MSQDPFTGMVSLPTVEILTSCLVALEGIRTLNERVRELEADVSDLKGMVYHGQEPGV